MSRRLKIGCAIFVVLMIAGVVIPLKFLRSKPIEVDVEPVERADVQETVSAVPVAGQPAGMVKPDEVKVIPKVGGELISLLVEEGDRVARGQVIAYLDPRPLDLQLAQARETAESARARVAQARADLAVAPTRSETAVAEAAAGLDQAVASYDTALRGAREQEIAAAEAALKQAKAQAESSKASLDLMLAGPREENVAQAQAALTEAQAHVELREAELDSQRGLAQRGYIPRNALKAAETAYQTAIATRAVAKERLAVTEEPHRPQEIEQAQASYRAALAAVEGAEHNLELTRNRTTPEELQAAEATVKQAQAGLRRAEAERVSVREQELQVAMLEADRRRSEAALEQAADQAGYTVIRAPIDGVVTRINVEEGEYVQGGGIALPSAEIAMLVITSDYVWIECNIDESDVGEVAEAQEVDIFLTHAEELKGVVHHVSPSVRLVQGDVRTFAVQIAVDEGARRLRSGMSVDVDIIVESTEDAVSVSSFAIFEDKEGNEYVYVVEASKARKRKITKGAEGIERTEITDGVKEGEQVITSLEAKGLRDGQKVKIRDNETDEKEKEQ